jgi:hypothetical protein
MSAFAGYSLSIVDPSAIDSLTGVETMQLGLLKSLTLNRAALPSDDSEETPWL